MFSEHEEHTEKELSHMMFVTCFLNIGQWNVVDWRRQTGLLQYMQKTMFLELLRTIFLNLP